MSSPNSNSKASSTVRKTITHFGQYFKHTCTAIISYNANCSLAKCRQNGTSKGKWEVEGQSIVKSYWSSQIPVQYCKPRKELWSVHFDWQGKRCLFLSHDNGFRFQFHETIEAGRWMVIFTRNLAELEMAEVMFNKLDKNWLLGFSLCFYHLKHVII